MTIYRENETMKIINSLCDVSLEQFDDRLRLQKVAFLAQKLGASGGFTFSWYRRGPYSPSLTTALFQCESAGELGITSTLNSKENSVVRRLNILLGKKINDPRTLELFASVWYFLPRSNVSAKDKDETIRDVTHFKPKYTKKEISSSVEKILKFRKTLRL